MVGELFQNSTKNIYSTSTTVFPFKQNIHPTSTIVFTFKKNTYSTSIVFTFKKNIHSTSSINNCSYLLSRKIFVQLQRYVFVQLQALKYVFKVSTSGLNPQNPTCPQVTDQTQHGGNQRRYHFNVSQNRSDSWT